MTDYILIRSKRRTAAIHIKNGSVVVRAPLKMAKLDIDKFVLLKERWIAEHLAKSQTNAERRESFALSYGDAVAFRGTNYPLTAKPGERAGFDGERFYLPPDLSPEQIKQTVIQIYRRLAKRHLTERVEHYAKLMNVSPSAVKVNGAKTRWGSCSTKKSLNFSWLLIMADDAVIDYVVVHELAHIIEMNHSARFWAIVTGVLPDCKEHQKRLKVLQKRLNAEDWERQCGQIDALDEGDPELFYVRRKI
jgi:predicted metal-dependent hydrolase